MNRLPDWGQRMHDLIKERLACPFSWTSNNCGVFAADAVLAQTGVDHAKGFRGLSARDAKRLMQKRGGLKAMATRALGEPCGTVRPGDIALVRNGGRELLGVFNGSIVLAPGRTGLVGLPVSAIVCAWGV